MPQPLNDQSPSETLYAGLRDDRVEVQTSAYEVLWRYLFRVAWRMTRSRPDGEALAQDCAQIALTRVYERLDECREPAALRSWSRRIVSNLVIDRLRRLERQISIDYRADPDGLAKQWADRGPTPDELADKIDVTSLRDLLEQSPMSERSKRVVFGRFFDEQPDEKLAERESQLAGRAVKPSHIQVTRAKNIAKLRQWPTLFVYLGKVSPF